MKILKGSSWLFVAFSRETLKLILTRNCAEPYPALSSLLRKEGGRLSLARRRSPRWRMTCGGRGGWAGTEVCEEAGAGGGEGVHGGDGGRLLFPVLPVRPDWGRCGPDLFRAYPSTSETTKANSKFHEIKKVSRVNIKKIDPIWTLSWSLPSHSVGWKANSKQSLQISRSICLCEAPHDWAWETISM